MLLIDLDPQGNASTGLGVERSERSPGTYEFLLGLAPLADCVRTTQIPGLSVMPASVQLAGAEIELIDVDRRALDAAARNITDPRARFVWADVTAMDAPDTPVDFVVTNPPFHMGGIEDKGLGQAFVRTAARLLRRDGACWLVANRHLPYEQVLRDHFARVHMVHEADGFKIIRAERG